jgi:hypothetical protein
MSRCRGVYLPGDAASTCTRYTLVRSRCTNALWEVRDPATGERA